MIKFVFLSQKFYEDYAECHEIEQKMARPYIRLGVLIDELLFCVPLRSHISHPHVLWTDKENHCGVDFSKAVVIVDAEKYIDQTETPHIRENEFKELKGKEHIIEVKLRKYIAEYKKAKKKPDIPRNRKLLEYSTLQYFEEYI